MGPFDCGAKTLELSPQGDLFVFHRWVMILFVCFICCTPCEEMHFIFGGLKLAGRRK